MIPKEPAERYQYQKRYNMELNRIYNEECLEGMGERIPDNSIDMILADLPYGTTACKWGSIIPLEPLWKQYKRIIRPQRIIALTATQPFTTTLINSNSKWFKYEWIWIKKTSAGFIHAKNKPIRRHENILIFSDGAIAHKSRSNNRMKYDPQGLKKIDKIHSRPQTCAVSEDTVIGDRPSHKKKHKVEYENYPTSIIRFGKGNHDNKHPTQKPVDLFKYLIKTYTDKSDIVLDNVIGSGTTAVAAKALGRKYIGFEQDEEYYEIAEERISEVQKELI